MALAPEELFTKEETLLRLFELSRPHVAAIEEAVEAAFPDFDSDVGCIAALAFQLNWQLLELSPERRSLADSLVKAILGRTSRTSTL